MHWPEIIAQISHFMTYINRTFSNLKESTTFDRADTGTVGPLPIKANSQPSLAACLSQYQVKTCLADLFKFLHVINRRVSVRLCACARSKEDANLIDISCRRLQIDRAPSLEQSPSSYSVIMPMFYPILIKPIFLLVVPSCACPINCFSHTYALQMTYYATYQ